MNRFLYLVLATALAASSAVAQKKESPFPKLAVKDGEQLLFLGDSISQSGQYIAFIQLYLWAEHPDLNLDIVNLGLGSETASGNSEDDHPFPRPCIHTRLDSLIEKTAPDVVFSCYGMNDGIYHPFSEKRFADYQNGINELLRKLDQKGRRFVLMTPPPFDAETYRLRDREVTTTPPEKGYGYKVPFADYGQVLTGYAKWIREEKAKDVDIVVDLHSQLSQWLSGTRKNIPKYQFGDGIHPPIEGHLKMALTALESLGVDPKKAEARLSELTGVTLDPETTKPTKFWDDVLKRHRGLTSSWIKHVGHSKPGKSNAPPVDEAKIAAAAQEAALRKQLSK